MSQPRLVAAMAVEMGKECECCGEPSNLRILIDYDRRGEHSDVFSVCYAHAAIARSGKFNLFFELYGKKVTRRTGFPPPAWSDSESLPMTVS